MKIKLSPDGNLPPLVASVYMDAITINGEVLDFSALEEGDTLEAGAVNNRWVHEAVHRIDGEILLTLALPHGPNAPQETLFPVAFEVPMTVTEGIVPLPPYDSSIGGSAL